MPICGIPPLLGSLMALHHCETNLACESHKQSIGIQIANEPNGGPGCPHSQEARFGLYHSVVTPSQVLCHPHNRANQMLSWLDMWDKGQKMMAIGMKRQFLGESMAIEISPDPAKKSEQLMANENLIKEANGAMAPMTGSERSLVAMTAIRFMLFVSFQNHKQLAGIPCFHCFHLFMSMLRFPQLVHQPHHSFSEGHQPWLPAR